MTRFTHALDRILVLIVVILLLGGAAAAGWWWTGTSPGPREISTDPALTLVDQAWWPWASAAVGVLLVLLGLRWIAAHLGRGKVDRLRLSGSGRGGSLDVSATKVADAAAQALTDTLGVRSARGTVRRDRGQLVARLDAVIEPEADLTEVAARADEVSGLLAGALGRSDLRCSVNLRVARLPKSLPRVS